MTAPVAIVTAASRGIGAACAELLAARGYRVALLARRESIVAQGAALGGFGMQGSVTRESDLAALVSRTMDAYGRIDAVVNNTGDPARADLLDLTDAQWRDSFDLLLLNVVRMARLVTPIMVAQGGGAIVNISASDAYEPDARFPMGSTLRAALGAWTKLYADHYGPSGIRMNCVCPSVVLPEGHPAEGDALRQTIPLRRAGRFAEIAQATAFLLSTEAAYITGQNLRVDGGLTRSV